MKKSIICLLILGLLFGLIGCQNKTQKQTIKTIIDTAGDKVDIPAEINKVICINPTVTEYMIAFGLGDRLIGTHKNALNKVWLQQIYPAITSLKAYGYNANAEEVLAAGADLVIVPQPSTAEALRSSGVCALTIWLNDADDPYCHVRILGEIFGKETESRINKWADDVENVASYIQSELDANGIQSGPSVYMINGQSNKGVFYPQGGGGSALEGYLNRIRAKMALHEFDGSKGIMPTEEEILKTNPDVITIGGAYGIPLKEEILKDPIWQDISAIKNNRVYIIPIGGIGWDQGYIAMPVMLEYLANVFYPDVFSFDIVNEGISFYREYFEAELTEQDIQNMMQDLTPQGIPAWE